ncbi:hypothetical protein [Micromonospora sp. ATA51]|nr:hypothetical protein [Micromonospora sp. ATA51]MBM0229126.1 hypothetical protein [Micromonospora sp. ATA51]
MSEGDVFAALANPTRRELLRLLLERGEQPVQRLATTSTCGARACRST